MTREEAIEHLKNMAEHSYPNEEYLMAIKSLEQEPKAGHWMKVVDEDDGLGNMTWHHECSMCNKSGWGEYKYCPNCGAKMAESEEEQ